MSKSIIFAMSLVLGPDVWTVSDSLWDPDSRRESSGSDCALLLGLLALYLGVAGAVAAFPFSSGHGRKLRMKIQGMRLV